MKVQEAKMTEWITTQEAAELSGYHVEYVRELIRSHKIDAEKIGNNGLINKASILTFLEEANQSEDKRNGPRKGLAKH
jgi:excisionase family DNA binding protein